MTEHEINRIVSENLNRLLEERNITQQELAEYIGVTQASVSNWCKGIKMPRMDKIDKICQYLDVERSALMKDSSEYKYYFDSAAAKVAEELYKRDDLRVLFDAARDVSEEDIRCVATLLEKLKKKEGK